MLELLRKLKLPRDRIGIALVLWRAAMIIATAVTWVFSYLAGMATRSAKCASMRLDCRVSHRPTGLGLAGHGTPLRRAYYKSFQKNKGDRRAEKLRTTCVPAGRHANYVRREGIVLHTHRFRCHVRGRGGNDDVSVQRNRALLRIGNGIALT